LSFQFVFEEKIFMRTSLGCGILTHTDAVKVPDGDGPLTWTVVTPVA